MATLEPGKEIFQKDYLPPAREVKPEDLLVDNQDGFFTGLPELSKRQKGKRIGIKSFSELSSKSKVEKLTKSKQKIEKELRLEKQRQAKKSTKMIKISQDELNKLQTEVQLLKGVKEGEPHERRGRTPKK